ncbi:MAG: FHA domain-containing protein, partial [Lapillicoccus sp.]
SRNHVQVVVEGWQVLVRDLDTTNGTSVTLPGGAPQRLRTGEAQVLEPGAVVSLADEVTFAYEVAPDPTERTDRAHPGR